MIDFILILKSLDWFFIAWVIWGLIHLIWTKVCYNTMLRFLNWLIKCHDFEGQVIGTEKAYIRYKKEIIVMLIFNISMVIFIGML